MDQLLNSEVIQAIIVIITTVITSVVVMIRSKKFNTMSSTVDAQLSNNGGSSLIDKIDKVVTKLDDISLSVSRLEVWKTAWMQLSDRPIFITTSKGRCAWVNNEYLQQTGTVFSDVEGMGWIKIIFKDDLARVAEEWRSCVENGTLFNCVYRHMNLQTKIITWIRCKAKPLVQNNDVVGFIGIWEDVQVDPLTGSPI